MTARIILATFGSLGDLHPFLAIGQALKKRGAHPVMAIPETNIAKAEAAGLEAVPVVPGMDRIAADYGMDAESFARKAFGDAPAIAKTVLLPYFNEAFDKLDAIAGDADLIAGATYMFAAPVVAEKRNLPYATLVLQPLSLLSDYDPPLLWEYPVLALNPQAEWQVAWNRFANFFMRVELRRRYSFSLNRLRRARGLGPVWMTPFFDVPPNNKATVVMYSKVMGDIQPDFPPNTHIVGFPQFDSENGKNEDLPDDLKAFLEDGEPPIVFTLGSFSVYAPGSFFISSREAARRLGRRSVIITGSTDTSLSAPDCFCVRYARISQLFPRGAVIVHHGGIGTTGTALRSGRPQLVVPHFGDHPDHAARVKRIGAGLVIKHTRYSVENATKALSALLENPAYAERAAELGEVVRAENPAGDAADMLLGLLDGKNGK